MKNTRSRSLIFTAITVLGAACGGGGRTTGVTGISVADMAGPIAKGPTVGGGDMGAGGVDSTCGGFVPTGVAACDACLTSSSCCALCTSCGNDASCVALVNCLGNCAQGDSACVQSCATQNQAGVSALQAFQGCIQSSCDSACNGGGGGGAVDMATGSTGACGTLQTGVAACDTCLDSSCCSQASACSNSTACMAYLDCLQTNNCTTQACANTCSTQHPGGATPYNALNTCLSTNCATQCM